MNMRKFTIAGFASFYHSFLRFRRDLDSGYAMKFTYSLYAMINEIYLLKNPGACIIEYNEYDFSEALQKSKAKPYRTEVQLFRAMEAVAHYYKMPIIKSLSVDCARTYMDLSFMMEGIEGRFYNMFDMEIYDKRTVYNLCSKSLKARRDEPGLCLLQDWLDISTA